MSDWLALLQQAVADDPRGITGVAQAIGYSRPAISRVLGGSYGNPDKLAAQVLATYARVACPHLATTLDPADCAAYAARRYSAISAADVPHFRACRACPNNPANKGTES